MRGFFALALISCCTWAAATTLTGIVVSVTDGDTLLVLAEDHRLLRVRIAGIDAPEAMQPHGQQAKEFLDNEISGKVVVLDISKTDRYGRWISRVSFQGRDVGLSSIEAGLAWHFSRYAHEQERSERDAYAAAETSARVSGMGLWVNTSPIPPWQWRRRGRN